LPRNSARNARHLLAWSADICGWLIIALPGIQEFGFWAIIKTLA
jgi:hypothetical protein